MSEWLDHAKELHTSGHWDGATAAALIGLLEWVEGDKPTHVHEDVLRQADDLEHLVWETQENAPT
jgi:hypothetical protein